MNPIAALGNNLFIDRQEHRDLANMLCKSVAEMSMIVQMLTFLMAKTFRGNVQFMTCLQRPVEHMHLEQNQFVVEQCVKRQAIVEMTIFSYSGLEGCKTNEVVFSFFMRHQVSVFSVQLLQWHKVTEFEKSSAMLNCVLNGHSKLICQTHNSIALALVASTLKQPCVSDMLHLSPISMICFLSQWFWFWLALAVVLTGFC